jgi:UDP-glucose:(heptosyl)LPS alpha-1,3-glucosyltransferase
MAVPAMRIAFRHRALAGGGTEADLRRMAAGLVERGHAVHVFCAKPGEAPPGVVVRRVRVPRGGRLVRLLGFALAAPRVVARESFDVVVGFGRTPRQDVVRVGGGTHRAYLAAMEAAGLRRAGRGPYHSAILWLERRQFSPAGQRAVLTVSQRAADEVTSDYGVARERVHVIYNGVDLERFHPAHRATRRAGMRASLGVADGAPLCLAVGTGFARKGFDLLLALWRAAPPAGATLVLVGDDERLAWWRRQATDTALEGRVIVTGPRPDVDALLAAADVLCLPSRQEAFGNVVLEACAAGVPPVTARNAGVAELLDGPLATLVVGDPTDTRALGAAIGRALGPEGERLARAARARAERLPWRAHLDAVERFLSEVAGAR